MRQTIAKSLRKQIVEYMQKKELSTAHAKHIYKKVKKGYNGTPRKKRKDFSIYE